MAKKDEKAELPKVPFERPLGSSNLSMGVVGLPNTGKSTLFNRLTAGSVAAENYPFCTIDPTVGHLWIDDPRVSFLEGVYKPKKTVSACLTVTDIAGLVRGASEGQGLGNQFLEHIRGVDGIFLVARCFEDPEIIHVENSVDPLRDIGIIREELRVKDNALLCGALARAEREVRAKPGDKKIEKAAATIRRLIDITKERWVSEDVYDTDELGVISRLNLLTTKNVVILANISAKHYETRRGNKHLKAVIDAFGDSVIPFSATAGGVGSPFPAEFITKLVSKGYDSLGLMNFFTVGKDEVAAWTIRRGVRAPVASRAIHTDFEKYFVCAEVMPYEAFVEHPSEVAMRAAGKYLQKGRDYVVQDGDIILFKINAPKSKLK